MDEKNNIVFNSPKNFKRGKYIFGRFRLLDAAVILVVFFTSLSLMILYLNVFQSKNILMNLIMVLIFLIPDLVVYILFMPMPVYLNILEYLNAFKKFHTRQRRFKWEGIHQFDEEDRYEEER